VPHFGQLGWGFGAANGWLARMGPYEPNYDRRTYECDECDHSIIVVVKYK